MPGNGETVAAERVRVFRENLLENLDEISAKYTNEAEKQEGEVNNVAIAERVKFLVDEFKEIAAVDIEQFNLDQRLEKLEELKAASDSTPAWRPVTGRVAAQDLRVQYLLKKKELLQQKIQNCKSATAVLCEEIEEKRQVIKQQTKLMEERKFS